MSSSLSLYLPLTRAAAPLWILSGASEPLASLCSLLSATAATNGELSRLRDTMGIMAIPLLPGGGCDPLVLGPLSSAMSLDRGPAMEEATLARSLAFVWGERTQRRWRG